MAETRVRKSFKQEPVEKQASYESAFQADAGVARDFSYADTLSLENSLPEIESVDGPRVLKKSQSSTFTRSFDDEAEYITHVPEDKEPSTGQKIKQKAVDKTPKKLKNPSELQVRVRTGAVYIGLTVACILGGEISTAIYLAVLCAICANEFYYMLNSDAKLANEFLGIIAAAALPISMWAAGLKGIVVVYSIFIIALLVWYVFWKHARIVDVSVSLFGATYTGLLMSSAVIIRDSLPDIWGGVLLLCIFLSVWANDAFAYLFGSAFGKHKLAPSISPKKSWEGFIGGLVMSLIFWWAITLIPGVDMSIPQAVVIGLVCGIVGVLGDLVESRIKRNSGFKDSGTIMPGHGGLLDRCDSQFLVTVVSALLLTLCGCIPFSL